MIVVSDTSAITSLLQIGRVDLLAAIYGDVFIPEGVHNELANTHAQVPAFIRVKAIVDAGFRDRLLRDLDVGEAEAIVLAKELKADELLIDESDGRRVAMNEGLNVVGLLGVLLEAKAQRLISSVRQVTDELEAKASFYVSDKVKEMIFREAGEP